MNRMILGLCVEHAIPCTIQRYIPDDFRSTKYRIAKEFVDQLPSPDQGRALDEPVLGGQNINNLKESIESVAERGELGRIRNLTTQLQERVVALIEKCQAQR